MGELSGHTQTHKNIKTTAQAITAPSGPTKHSTNIRVGKKPSVQSKDNGNHPSRASSSIHGNISVTKGIQRIQRSQKDVRKSHQWTTTINTKKSTSPNPLKN